MKFFALTVLLISICYVQGGLVKRQAEEEPQGEIPSVFTAQFTEFFQRLQQETEGFALSIKDSFGQSTVDDIRTQFQTALQQVQDSLNPLTEQVKQHVGRLFTIPELAQAPAEDQAQQSD